MSLPRMRTIKETAAYLKQQDPDTALGETYLRNLIRRGELKCHKAGTRYLVDLSRLEEYLANPPQDKPESANDYGKLRKIQ